MILPDFRIKSGGKVALADIEKKTAYADRIQNGIRLMKQLEEKDVYLDKETLKLMSRFSAHHRFYGA